MEKIIRFIGALLLLATAACGEKLSPEAEHFPRLPVKVVAHQFAWEFTQPGADGLWGTADDVRTTNRLSVPEKRRIDFEFESRDVIHGFWVPKLGWKFTVVPGATLRRTLPVTKPGHYKLACAELCGAQHASMVGWVEVLPEMVTKSTR